MLTLVSFDLCPYVQRAAIALAEKGVAFERRTVDLANRPAWFTEISPLGKVPLLMVGGAVLFESAARPSNTRGFRFFNARAEYPRLDVAASPNAPTNAFCFTLGRTISTWISGPIERAHQRLVMRFAPFIWPEDSRRQDPSNH